MGSIYLPGTIDAPRKEIIRYEGGYIRNILGVLIGRYDDKCVYEGSSKLNTHFIGRMQFNYGYLRESNEIFVISHKNGTLSVGQNKCVAYFDGDETGAIAAFILAYRKGMIEDISTSSSNAGSIPPINVKGSLPGCGGNDTYTPAGGSLSGCFAVLGIGLFIVAAFYSSFVNWWDVFTTPISLKSIEENWGIIFPILAAIVGIVIYIVTNKSILEAFTVPFIIQSIIVAVLYAIYSQSPIIGFALGLLGAVVAFIVPFLFGAIIAIILKKLL